MRRLLFSTAAISLLLALAAPAHAQRRGGPGCDLLNADVTVHGIRLGDRSGTNRVLGDDDLRRAVIIDPMSDFPWYVFASRDNKQLLELRRRARDVAYSFREAEVKYGRHDRGPRKLNTWEFVTGRGIKLGVTRRFVVGRFGTCFSSATKGRNETIRYAIESQPSEFLKRNGLESYYAEYEFRRGRLIRFRFGQEPI